MNRNKQMNQSGKFKCGKVGKKPEYKEDEDGNKNILSYKLSRKTKRGKFI